jgi:hypothetical protein
VRVLRFALWFPQSRQTSQQLLPLIPGPLGIVLEHLGSHFFSNTTEVGVDSDVRFAGEHDLELFMVFTLDRSWPARNVDTGRHADFGLFGMDDRYRRWAIWLSGRKRLGGLS